MTVAETLSETKDDFIEYIFYIYKNNTDKKQHYENTNTNNTRTNNTKPISTI